MVVRPNRIDILIQEKSWRGVEITFQTYGIKISIFLYVLGFLVLGRLSPTAPCELWFLVFVTTMLLFTFHLCHK